MFQSKNTFTYELNSFNKNEKQMSALLFLGTLVSHYLNSYIFDCESIVVGQVLRGEAD